MPSLIDMRRRIRAVKSTQQITKAMKMVAASKLRRAQERVVATRPFAREARRVLASIASRVDQTKHPLLVRRAGRRARRDARHRHHVGSRAVRQLQHQHRQGGRRVPAREPAAGRSRSAWSDARGATCSAGAGSRCGSST